MEMTYKEILPGIKLRYIESDRFETSCISVQFKSKVDARMASGMTLVPRVLRRGTVKHPDMESLAAALDDLYGARIEPISRKCGDVMTTGFIADFTDAGEADVFHSLIKLMREVIFEPKTEDGALSVEYVESERANLIDEIKSEINNKLSYAHQKAMEVMFCSGPYGVSELGTEESAEHYDSEKLTRLYKKMIATYPCEIFFCGRASIEEVERELLYLFKLCNREKINSVTSDAPVYCEEKRICERLDIAQANLLVGMRVSSADIYTAKLLATVLGGGTTSKLFVNVREKKSLCYFAGAMFDSFGKSLFMYCGIDPKNSDVAEKAVLNELNECIAGNITDEELVAAKKHMIDGFITTEDSPFSMESFWLRASLIGDERSPEEVASAINAIDGESLSETARGLKKCITYLLTGMEGGSNDRKLLPDA